MLCHFLFLLDSEPEGVKEMDKPDLLKKGTVYGFSFHAHPFMSSVNLIPFDYYLDRVSFKTVLYLT